MSKGSYSLDFLRRFVGDLAGSAAEDGVGDGFVKICEHFCTSETAAGAVTSAAMGAAGAGSAAAGAAGAGLGLSALGPIGISLALFGVVTYMKRAREAKEAKEKQAAIAEIRAIADAVAAVRTKQQGAEEMLVDLVEQKSPVWARISGADQKDFARVFRREVAGEFEAIGEDLRELKFLGFDTNERVRKIEESLDKVLRAGGSSASPLISSNVPAVPDSYVRRDKPMRELREKLTGKGEASVTGRVQAAAGGGYGKTVLAYGYAAEFRDQYPGGVFKIGCEGRNIVSGMAELLAVDERNKELSEDERAKLVKAKLSSPEACLLILDNVEGAEQWGEYRKSDVLPTPPCHLILTTRDEQIHDVAGVSVDRLEHAEAIELLAKFRECAAKPENAAAIETILRETERIAALVAAVGMAMAEDASDDWAGYAAWLAAAKPEELPDAQNWIKNWRDYPHKTVSILDDLRRRLHPAMVRILDYSSMLPADQICRVWLEFLIGEDAKGTVGVLALDLGRDSRGQARHVRWYIEQLEKRGLLRPSADFAFILSVHRLHRKRAADHIGADKVIEEAMRGRVAALVELRGEASRNSVTGDLGDKDEDSRRPARDALRAELGPLVALVESLLAGGSLLTSARLVNWIQEPLRELGRYGECRSTIEMIFADVETLVAEGWPEEASAILCHYGLVLKSLGDLKGAGEHLKGAIDIILRHFTADHFALGPCYSALAQVFRGEKKYHDAQTCIENAIAISLKYLDPDHPQLATYYTDAATVQYDMEDYVAARANIERSIEIGLKYSPREDTKVAARYSNLAAIQVKQGDLQGARANLERAIAIERRYFDSDHPTLGFSYNNLGHICFLEGNGAAACSYLAEALKIFRKHFDANHPNVKTVRTWASRMGCDF